MMTIWFLQQLTVVVAEEKCYVENHSSNTIENLINMYENDDILDKSHKNIKEGWEYQEGEGWYFYENGKRCMEGWKYISNSWYYLDPHNELYPGLMVEGKSKEIDGKIYGFDSNGKMVEGGICNQRVGITK